MLQIKHRITRKMFIDTLIVLTVAELTGAATCLIDGLITGRFLGNNAMAAYNYSCTYFSIVSIVNGILLVGNQTLCVSAVSKGDRTGVNCLISLSTVLGVGATLLITIIMFIFPKQTAILFGAQENNAAIMADIVPYLRGVCVGAPFWCLFVMLTPIVQLDGGGSRAKIAALVAGIADVVLDCVLGVVLKLGMQGMGLATAVSHATGCVITASWFFSEKSSYKFVLKEIRFEKAGELLKNGLPRATSMIARTVGPIILNLILVGIAADSSDALTALSTQRTISFCVASPGWGICGTALMLGTLFYNGKNMPEMKALIKYCLVSIICAVGALSLLLVLVSPIVVRLFQPDWRSNMDLCRITTLALRYYAASLPFLAFNVSFAAYIQSVGKNGMANVVNASVECVFLVIACYFMARYMQFEGFFKGFFYGQLALSLVIVLYIFIHRALHKNEAYSLYFIKDGYINENDRVLQASLETLDDIEKFSTQAHELCCSSHLSASQAYKVGLCVEELACNVFKHGFQKDNKKHMVEMRLTISDAQAVITLIDDCSGFDISRKLKTWEIDPEHPEKNIGIRTIMLLSRQVIYSNTMNMNNLQIII